MIDTFDYTYDEVGDPTLLVEANGDRRARNEGREARSERRHGRRRLSLLTPLHSFLTYDPGGNRATIAPSTTYTYDASGNLLVGNVPGELMTLTWGYEDEMLTAHNAGGTLTTITYDGDLKRRKRAQAAAWTTYLWEREQVLLELNKNDDTVVRYTQAPRGYGDLVSQRRGGATSFYHFNAIGTTRAL